MAVVSASETVPRKEIEERQLERLKKLLEHACNNSDFYRRRFDEAKVKPEDIKSLQDVSKIPLLNDDLIREEVKRTEDSFGGLLCCSPEMVRMVSFPVVKEDKSTPQGWRGFERMPWLFGYSRTDFDRISAMLTRMWQGSGVTFDTTFQINNQWPDIWGQIVAPSLWRSGTTLYPGTKGVMALALNITVPRYSKPQFLCTPIHVAKGMVESAKGMGLQPKEVFSCYEKVFFNEGILTSQLSEDLRAGGFIGEHYNLYYVAEASFFAVDCEKHDGLHVPEDCFIVEVIDEATKQPVPLGDKGRLVVTNLVVEATPYIRYQTHETVTLNPEPCNCGRTHARINLKDFQTE